MDLDVLDSHLTVSFTLRVAEEQIVDVAWQRESVKRLKNC